jgi:hypothetical protein
LIYVIVFCGHAGARGVEVGYATIDFDKTVALINTTNPRYSLHSIQNSVVGSAWFLIILGSWIRIKVKNDGSGSASKSKLGGLDRSLKWSHGGLWSVNAHCGGVEVQNSAVEGLFAS